MAEKEHRSAREQEPDQRAEVIAPHDRSGTFGRAPAQQQAQGHSQCRHDERGAAAATKPDGQRGKSQRQCLLVGFTDFAPQQEDRGDEAAGDVLLEPLRARVALTTVSGDVLPPPLIELSRLGNDAGVIGAAMLYSEGQFL